MVVRDLDVERVAVFPAKTHPVLIVDADAVLSQSISFQCLETVCWWRREIAKFGGAVDLDQPPERNAFDALQSRHSVLPEEFLGVLIAKRPDHTDSIARVALYASDITLAFAAAFSSR